MSEFAVTYVVVSEAGAGHHVAVRRIDSPGWLQVVATFALLERAEQYADIENDMWEDNEQTDWSDLAARPPAANEPASGRPALREAANVSDHLLDMARLEGRREAEEAAKVASTPAVAPAPEPPPQAAAPPQPVREAPEPPRASPKAWIPQADRIANVRREILATLPAIMRVFPDGPTAKDLADRLGAAQAEVGTALREMDAKGAVVYGRFEVPGDHHMTKRLRPSSPKVDLRVNAPEPVSVSSPSNEAAKSDTPPPVAEATAQPEPKSEPVCQPEAEHDPAPVIVETITDLSPVDELVAVIWGALPDLMKEFPNGPTVDDLHARFGGKIEDLRLACLALGKRGDAKSYRTGDVVHVVPIDRAPPSLPAVVEPAGEPVPDSRNHRIIRTARGHVIDRRDAAGGVLSLGEPSPGRSALFERQLEQERARQREDARP